jgi:hypothetical protein
MKNRNFTHGNDLVETSLVVKLFIKLLTSKAEKIHDYRKNNIFCQYQALISLNSFSIRLIVNSTPFTF